MTNPVLGLFALHLPPVRRLRRSAASAGLGASQGPPGMGALLHSWGVPAALPLERLNLLLQLRTAQLRLAPPPQGIVKLACKQKKSHMALLAHIMCLL